jgi:peptidoglycan/xylan/chitin deacetylase (PgdA/CDA1 family)
VAETAAVGRLVGAVERLDARRPNLLRVLTYHRVDDPVAFGAQAAFLARSCATVSAADVLASLGGGPPLPPRAVLLTFDDAYRSFATDAWPVLRSLGIPALLFVPTAYPDSERPSFWWDRVDRTLAQAPRGTSVETFAGCLSTESAPARSASLRTLKLRLKDLPHRELVAEVERLCTRLGVPPGRHDVLGWDELRRLAREGVTLGAHTRTHPVLTRVPPVEAESEIAGSLADLEREIGPGPRLLAYPDGRHDDGVVGAAARAGVELAVTTRRGTNDLRAADRLRLRRIHVEASDPRPVLRARLLYSSVYLNRLRPLFDPQAVT